MNREIKFRAWDGKSMSKNVRTIQELANGSLTSRDADKLIWLQYIGRKDKKGNDIHDGDIIKYVYKFYNKQIEVVTDVYWNYNGFYLRVNMTKLIDSRAFMHIERYGEIIGNIYQSPELLKQPNKRL